MKYDARNDVTQSAGKVYILPVKEKGKVRFSLVYDIQVETTQPAGKFNSFVDAHSGNIIWRLNKVHDVNTNINVNGWIKEKYSYDSQKLKSFPNQYVNIGTERFITDSNGKFSKDISTNNSVSSRMQGRWAKIVYEQSSRDSAYFENTISPGNDFTLNWTDNNSHLHERMLFYHTNYIHDYVKKLDPLFEGMDFQVVITIIPESFMYNAGSDGRDITFYGTESPPNHFAETPAILYHEYTHSINAQLYLEHGGTQPLGMINGSVHEATADLGPAFMYDDHIIGKGAYEGDTNENVRNIDNINIYPDSIEGEPHHDGLILSGAFWDLRMLTSREIAEHIVHFTKYGTPDDEDDGIAFNEWFIESTLTDDNYGTGDNDPSNGTPHLMEICTAFNKHHIGTDLMLAFSFNHTPLEDTKNITDPYIVNFDLKSEPNFLNSHPDSTFVVYSTDNMKTLNFVPAVKVSPNDPQSTQYRAEIPAMPNGTMVKYYIQAIESVSRSTFKFTGTYPEFVPYQFLVGYESLDLEEFEIEPNWTVGGPGDNATNGLWEWAIPQRETLGTGNDATELQPGEDHTPVGSRCFVTGHLVNTSGGLTALMTNMPNGTTTLISRLYDLSKYSNTLVRFYKYFTSEVYFIQIPGAESTMIFEISSNGGTSWVSADTLNSSTGGWTKSQFVLDDYVNTTNRMRFRFVVHSQMFQQGMLVYLTEALVDDFEILYPGKAAPPNAVANFGAKPTSGVAPLSVQFIDSSKGNITSWWWDFGDNHNSSEQNPKHIYENNGSYNVTLTASNESNQDTKSKSNFINVISVQSDFSATPMEGTMPFEVQFTDNSKGTPASWHWDFGDGATSTQQNPKHTYTNEGKYSVILMVINNSDSSQLIKNDYITVYDAFGASFSADKTSGLIPLMVNFSDLSFGNPTTWFWEFGDGVTSEFKNPIHTYTVQGIYNVSLTITDGQQRQSTITKSDLISAYNELAVNEDGIMSGLSAYPNPFSTSTAIYYELALPAHVTLKIYDLMGNVVASLVDESQSDGRKFAVWSGFKSDGNKANPGMYIYRLSTGDKTRSGKLILY